MLRNIEPIYLIFGAVAFFYSIFASFSGEILSYQRGGLAEVVSIDTDPLKFWGTILVYISIAIALVIFGMKKCFPPRMYKLLDFDFQSSLSIKQVIFLLGFTGIMYAAVYFLAKILASI